MIYAAFLHSLLLVGNTSDQPLQGSIPVSSIRWSDTDKPLYVNLAFHAAWQGLLARFASQAGLWQRAVKAMAELDALMALAYAAQFGADGAPMCRPTFVEPSSPVPGGPSGHVFSAKALRHPAAGVGVVAGGTFVPNDVQLGDQGPGFIVLTGPNMGGKSTLLRQVGAWVPAHSLTLTPVDAIFVRMGAKDDVMSGQSTFFVELAETAAALNRATPASLVALDELGRGTATSDGAAIAAAVLEHLSAKTRCSVEPGTNGIPEQARPSDTEQRTVVHGLSIHVFDLAIAQGIPWWHYVVIQEDCLQCPPTTTDSLQGSTLRCLTVTFLYTLTGGACPKSYGINVARLAGLPDEVVTRAFCFATQLEEQHQSRMLSMPLQQSETQRLQSICQGMIKDCVSPDMQL
ncbi:hypothetical protein ABBQ38_002153 [Trebouxia sp. C0009 RCD-2024]